MTEPDLIQEAIRHAMIREAANNLRWFFIVVEWSCIFMVILLALILWRVW